MKKFLPILVCGLLASAAQAQTKDNTQTSAGSAPIGQAVSGHNTTAAGVSGTGLRTDGKAEVGSAHSQTGQQAAGVNAAGQVTGKSTAVIGVAPDKADNVNAHATNTTPPANNAADAKATGGRGEAGTKAEQEIRKSNTTKVWEPVGDRNKTANSVEEGKKKRAKVKEKSQRKQQARAEGRTDENR